LFEDAIIIYNFISILDNRWIDYEVELPTIPDDIPLSVDEKIDLYIEVIAEDVMQLLASMMQAPPHEITIENVYVYTNYVYTPKPSVLKKSPRKTKKKSKQKEVV
jgi:hypothetical protein